jgi:hypothetical protein
VTAGKQIIFATDGYLLCRLSSADWLLSMVLFQGALASYTAFALLPSLCPVFSNAASPAGLSPAAAYSNIICFTSSRTTTDLIIAGFKFFLVC